MNASLDNRHHGLERRLQAEEWYQALRRADPAHLDPEVIGRWQAWLLDAENRLAFDSVTRVLDAVHLTWKGKTRNPDEIASDPYDGSVRILDWLRSHPRPVAAPTAFPRNRPPALLALAAALIAVAFAVGTFVWRPGATIAVRPEVAKPALVYQTDGDASEDVRLQDGSTILLAAGTALSVSFTHAQRSITLTHGKAWFHVAHKPHWPFIVTAGRGQIVDLGTAFVVDREPAGVVVTVTEGAVQIDALPLSPLAKISVNSIPNSAATVRLTRGERISYDRQGVTGRRGRADIASATAWMNGMIEFDGVPLGDVVRTMARYAKPKIFVTPEAGRLPFYGLLSTKDGMGGFLWSLPQILPVSLVRGPRGVCVRMREEPPGESMSAGC